MSLILMGTATRLAGVANGTEREFTFGKEHVETRKSGREFKIT